MNFGETEALRKMNQERDKAYKEALSMMKKTPNTEVQSATDEGQDAKRSTYYMISIRSLMIGNKWYREPERYRLLSHATMAAKAFPKCREAKIFKVTEEEVA